MLRRQSIKHAHAHVEYSYKPYDFDSSKFRSSKSPSSSIPTHTPPNHKKLSLSSTIGSQSFLYPPNTSTSGKKRQDITSSSCGGDSGFSDCESSTHPHHHYRSFDLSLHGSTRSSNIRSLRTLSHPWKKKQGLIVQDASSSIKSTKMNHSQQNLTKADSPQRLRSQLSISSNSAFTQFVKRNVQEQDR